ncbi:MAG: radical SAM/Cys-rich domain protein [bacterium]|nr:radical SAM/Cys-rich domain protein [bacterium]
MEVPPGAPPDPFAQRLAGDGQDLMRGELDTLQLNLGKQCNLACHHCHVEAGPKRTEIMSWETMEKILGWIDLQRPEHPFGIVDLTGGAPEMNPHFRRLVGELRARDLHPLARSNLTILVEPGYEDLVDFLATREVEVVASLPCYLEENVDKQRGKGTFRRSIEALQRLNASGYGKPGTGLRLDLVHNPVGFGLPGAQEGLEADYRRELGDRFGVVFNRLWTITNMPINRFAYQLRRSGMFEEYMEKLFAAHGPANVEQVMCRSLVSVGWEGGVYDCDFNQILKMPLDFGGDRSETDEHQVERESRKLWQFTPEELIGRKIRTGAHCFGCTAGAGSSCTGALG